MHKSQVGTSALASLWRSGSVVGVDAGSKKRDPTLSKIGDIVRHEHCWAKTKEDGSPGINVRDHCLNVGCVAQALVALLPPQLHQLIPHGAATLAALHDVGKASPGFQVKSQSWLRQHMLMDRALRECWSARESDHAKISQFAVQQLLATRVQIRSVSGALPVREALEHSCHGECVFGFATPWIRRKRPTGRSAKLIPLAARGAKSLRAAMRRMRQARLPVRWAPRPSRAHSFTTRARLRIPALPGRGINSAGQVVGTGLFGRAFLYDGNTVFDLGNPGSPAASVS